MTFDEFVKEYTSNVQNALKKINDTTDMSNTIYCQFCPFEHYCTGNNCVKTLKNGITALETHFLETKRQIKKDFDTLVTTTCEKYSDCKNCPFDEICDRIDTRCLTSNEMAYFLDKNNLQQNLKK